MTPTQNRPPSQPHRTFEQRLKSWLMAMLGKLAPSPEGPPDWGSRPHRVLFLRYDRIGDMVLATATIKAIATAYPTIIVDVLASELNAAVLQGNPHVGAVMTLNKKRPLTFLKAIVRMRRGRYDAVVDSKILGSSLTATLLMLSSGARHRIGLAGRGNDSVLTVPVAPIEGATHIVDRSAALVAAFVVPVPVGVQPELFLTAMELSEGEAHWRHAESLVTGGPCGRRLLVNVSASSARRYWPEGKFITALTQIRASYPDAAVLIVGLPGDRARMSKIGVETGTAVADTPHYRQMMAIVAASDVVLTADTSVTHIASAYRKPSVVIFPGKADASWGPYGTPGVIVSPGESVSIEFLEVDPVVQALQELMRAVGTRRPQAA